MSFSDKMNSLADQIEGSYSEYDERIAVLIVPIDDHRFQTVYCYDEGIKGIRFISKVCEVNSETPYREILEVTSDLIYSSFYVENDFLYVKAMTFESATEAQLQDMLKEVANIADTWENKLTGADVH